MKSVKDQVWDQVDNVRNKIWDQVWSKIGKKKK